MSGQGGGDEAEKSHEPTPRKLEEARGKGQVPRSQDLDAAASYAGLALVAVALGGWSLNRAGEIGAGLVSRAERLAPLFTAPGGMAPAGGLLAALTGALSPWLLGPAAAVLVALIAQRAVVAAPDKLRPKLERISPVAGFGRKFGRSGLFEFAKSASKLMIISLLLGLFLATALPDLIRMAAMTPAGAVQAMAGMAVEFLLFVVVIQAAIGAVDTLWQHADHRRQLRMSHQELKDETKRDEGDPHIKQQRRARGGEILRAGNLGEVREASVVIVNPTHVAVALRWRHGDRAAPVCVAKGRGEIAARIRTLAAEAGVPVHRDPPTARALNETVAVGAEIRPEHYRAVAAAIRFADAMRARARAGWR